jgi:hypothetical protein
MDKVKVRTGNGSFFVCEIDTGEVCECRYCGADIVWATTPKGKKIPLEVEIVDGVTESHFAHCA